ncbi:parp domain-containing protein [Purpureocillium lavendulum]|uniref:Parp domain-containing protein n=1 Tax=Purpureocillium lavendulum TaxID=1247861 RepID=A0AB34FM49_9HYPO|nr:parp domain-containing protein [Purpureocillium lavendulum]
MKASLALLTVLAGFAAANPTVNDKKERRACSPTVQTAIDAGVGAVKMAFSLAPPPNLQAALDDGVAAFKAKLGC